MLRLNFEKSWTIFFFAIKHSVLSFCYDKCVMHFISASLKWLVCNFSVLSSIFRKLHTLEILDLHIYKICKPGYPSYFWFLCVVELLNFSRQPKISNFYFIAVNGEKVGSVFEMKTSGCLGTLAKFAYNLLAPRAWQREGPKFLFSSSGIPVGNMDDVVAKADRELYVLNSRQHWIWPAHEIHLKFKLENFSLVRWFS